MVERQIWGALPHHFLPFRHLLIVDLVPQVSEVLEDFPVGEAAVGEAAEEERDRFEIMFR